MAHAYRSEYQQVVSARIAEMDAERELIQPLLPLLRSIRAARIARVCAGSVGILGMAATCLAALTEVREELTHLLLGSMGAMFATYIVVRTVMALGGLVRRRVMPTTAHPKLTGRLGPDLATIESTNAFRAIEHRLSRLEMWSTALPLIALSLLTPLTLHWGFVALTGVSETASSFAGWIRISLAIVGHAHLALAYMGYRFARKMRNASLQDIQRMSINREWAKAWGIAIGVSCMPFILLFAVPPILVAVTGIAFIPLMFFLMRHRLIAERYTLFEAEGACTVRAGVSDTKMFGDASWTDLMNPHPHHQGPMMRIAEQQQVWPQPPSQQAQELELDLELQPDELNSPSVLQHSRQASRA